jgi:hypothetical protein
VAEQGTLSLVTGAEPPHRLFRLSKSAWRTLVAAQAEAQGLGHPHVGPGHLLLGVLRSGGAAAAALGTAGLTPAQARQAVVSQIGQGATPTPGEPDFSPRARRVLDLVFAEADRMGQPRVDPSHVLLALIRDAGDDPRGLAARALLAAGVRPDDLRPLAEAAAGASAVPDRRSPSQGALRDLIDVVPVGVSQRAGATTLTLLSLERYGDGFLVQFRVLREATLRQEVPAGAAPEMRPAAADDRGGRYAPTPEVANRAARRTLEQWRLAYRYQPALPPDARELRLDVPRIEWSARDLTRGRLVTGPPESGPWTFAVPLPPLGPAA